MRHVQRVDSHGREPRDARRDALGDAASDRGVDEPHLVREGPPGRDDLEARMAEPEPRDRARRAGDSHHLGRGPGVLHVERELVRGAALAVEVGERRNVRGQRSSRQLPDRPAVREPVVVEHREAVGRDPDVGLEPARAELERERERRQRVLARASGRAAVGEADRCGARPSHVPCYARPMPLPRQGLPREAILAELDARKRDDVRLREGRVFSLAYFAGDEVYALAKEAYTRYLSENALNPEAFPSLRRLQSDVVEMVAGLVNGGPDAAGFMTTGGTESLLMAVRAARERGRAERGIAAPEMVLPTSAHAAFEKGADYFGVRSVRVPVGPDFRADPDAMRRAINANTVLVVASAPQYPQGVVDPVEPIAELAEQAGISCHVDACMGGMVLPFLERLGQKLPLWDFRVPGVTSISVDLHKYGYAAKGASVIVHRTKELRRHQVFTTKNWLGGLYGSSGVPGTRSGGPMAAAWAVLRHLGEDGYLRLTRAARDTTLRFLEAARAIPGLRVLGDPQVTLVAFTFDDVDPFAVGEALARRGWYVDRQGPPPSLHMTIHAGHADSIDAYLADLRACVDEARAAHSKGAQVAYGSVE
jgi:glutamate/tyrosine decarboxylase-like PLP-dependent enzyme